MKRGRIQEIKEDYEIDLKNLPEGFVQTIDKLLAKIADLEDQVEILKGYVGSPDYYANQNTSSLFNQVYSLEEEVERLNRDVRYNND